eukprot:m.78733 g.78733  ORF g.78733 m.78733 type:complete len:1139 (+) comp36115_c0_seq1:87-3503(+)
MDDLADLRKLENAGEVMMAPPGVVSQEERQQAEQVFLAFETASVSCATCQQIIETDCGMYVHFHAVSAMKRAIVREWPGFTVSDANKLRDFFTSLAIRDSRLPAFVRARVCEVVAVMLKCCMLSDGFQPLKDVFTQSTANLLQSMDHSERNVALCLLSALLTEFSSFRRSTSGGFSLNFHCRSKRKFEETTLLWEFILIVKTMTPFSTIESFDQLPVDSKELITSLLSISSQILSWHFLSPAQVQSTMASFANPSTDLKPPVMWRDILLNSDVLSIFFKLAQFFLGQESLSDSAMQCLFQLSSLSGSIFDNSQISFQYVNFFVSSFLQIIRVDVNGKDALSIANVLNKLVTTFASPHFPSLPPALLKNFIESLAHLTCSFNQASLTKETGVDGDTLYSEGFNQLLDCCTWFTLNAAQFPAGAFSQLSIDVFTNYLQCRLAASERPQTAEDIHELEEDDCIAFGAELTNVAILGRSAVADTLPLLCNVLKDRVAKYDEVLHFRQSHDQSFMKTAVVDLTSLHEGLHWLALIAGFFLANDVGDEMLKIPDELLNYSISRADDVTSVEDTVKLLSHVNDAGSFTSSWSGKEDDVVQIAALVLRLVFLETRFVGLEFHSAVSPLVCRSVVFFLHRWCLAYLLPDESLYERLSFPVLAAFGEGSESGLLVMKMLLDKVVFNLSSWSGETELVDDSADLLLALVQSRSRSLLCLRWESLWSLVRFALLEPSSSFATKLPSKTRKSVAKALVTVGSAVKDEGDRLEYWKKLLEPFQARYASTLSSHHASQDDVNVKLEMVTLVECISGLAMGAQKNNHNALFTFMVSMFASSVSLLGIYRECAEVVSAVLEMFVGVTEFLLPYLGEIDSLKLYEICLEMIREYSGCTGRKSRSVGGSENLSDDLSQLLSLLINLISKDCLNFSDEGAVSVEVTDAKNPVSVTDVVLFGLSIILPLVTMDSLRIPFVHSKYFKLVSFICELYPENVCCLPDDQFSSLMHSLEIGMNNFGVEITKLCLEGLSGLCDFHYKKRHENIRENSKISLDETLKNFFPVLFSRLVLHSFEVDLLQPAAEAFFSLICCYPSEYTRLLQNLVESKNNSLEQAKLLSLFNKLTPPEVALVPEPASKRQFRKRFDSFLSDLASTIT